MKLGKKGKQRYFRYYFVYIICSYKYPMYDRQGTFIFSITINFYFLNALFQMIVVSFIKPTQIILIPLIWLRIYLIIHYCQIIMFSIYSKRSIEHYKKRTNTSYWQTASSHTKQRELDLYALSQMINDNIICQYYNILSTA